MEISVASLHQQPPDRDYNHIDYNVTVDGHKILTLETYGPSTASMWLFNALGSPNTRSDGFVVGIAVDRERLSYSKRGVEDTPYDLIQLCIGSHCLIFHIPDDHFSSVQYRFDTTFLQTFFSNRRVTVVGMNMKAVAEKLERDYGIEIKNALDLNEIAVKGMRRDDLDLGRYDLDRLAKAVLGKSWDVVRPVRRVEWYRKHTEQWCYCYDWPLSMNKVKFATVDTYLCFSIGAKLLEMIRCLPLVVSPPVEIPKNRNKNKWAKKKKKKNTNKNKNKHKH